MTKVANTQDRERGSIYILKCLAVISIVSAHCTHVLDNVSELSLFISLFMQSIGSVGVGVFFLLSGYLYHPVEHYGNLRLFFRNKVKSLFIPWGICASMVYLYVALRKGGNLSEWFLELIGYKSSFWYLAVLVMLYTMCYFFYQKRIIMYGFMMLPIVFSIFLKMGIFHRTVLTIYLNPFYWCIYFIAGILLQKYAFKDIMIFAYKRLWVSIIVCFGIFVWLALNENHCSYFSIYYIPIEVIAIIASLSVCGIILESESKKLTAICTHIGKRSFSIYLLHEIGVAGMTAAVLNKFDLWWAIPLRPFIVIFLVLAIIEGGYIFFTKIKMEELYSIMIGGRK